MTETRLQPNRFRHLQRLDCWVSLYRLGLRIPTSITVFFFMKQCLKNGALPKIFESTDLIQRAQT